MAESTYAIRQARLPADRESMLAVLETANMHRVPSAEMEDFDVGRWFVAEIDGEIVGVTGFDVLGEHDEIFGKTLLLAVVPSAREHGIGGALQAMRMKLMREAGAARVITNADRPETIAWYERHFGYRRIGRVRKLHEFGLRGVSHWTTLEAPLR